MDRAANVRIEIGELKRVQQNAIELSKKALDGAPYGVELMRLFPALMFGHAGDFPRFMTSYPDVLDYVEHIADHVVDPQWRVPWTCGQFRKQSGIWVQSFWAMPPGRAKIEGRGESSDYFRAMHAACLDFVAKVIELRILGLMVVLERQKAREADAAGSAAFDERLRLAQEAIEAADRRRALRLVQDRDWENADPQRIGAPA